jgi:hypothetical protein
MGAGGFEFADVNLGGLVLYLRDSEIEYKAHISAHVRTQYQTKRCHSSFSVCAVSSFSTMFRAAPKLSSRWVSE